MNQYALAPAQHLQAMLALAAPDAVATPHTWQLARTEADGRTRHYVGFEQAIITATQRQQVLALGGVVFDDAASCAAWLQQYAM